MTNLIQTLISGLSLGSIYALIALGYTMVYGIAKMLNFAHGDVIMVGAYSGIVAVAQLGLSMGDGDRQHRGMRGAGCGHRVLRL